MSTMIKIKRHNIIFALVHFRVSSERNGIVKQIFSTNGIRICVSEKYRVSHKVYVTFIQRVLLINAFSILSAIS